MLSSSIEKWAIVCALIGLGCAAPEEGRPEPAAAQSATGGLGGGSGSGGTGGVGFTCGPGEGSCADGKATVCNALGTGFDEFVCDPLQGMVCDPDGCKGACSPPVLGTSYVGCDYWPTVTLNPVWSGFHYAVAVGNVSSDTATVTVTKGTATAALETVEAGAVRLIVLPWDKDLKGDDFFNNYQPGPTRFVKHGAYRLRSTAPVIVYQFDPVEYQIDPTPPNCWNLAEASGCFSFTNDASLLLPTNALTRDYAALTYFTAGRFASFIAVTATEDGTEVVLKKGARSGFMPGAGLKSSGEGVVLLDAGDVLEAIAPMSDEWIDDSMPPPPPGKDQSGTRVHASKPVQVIAGHACAFVPYLVPYCDHLEESMLPIETLGQDYLVTPPAAPGATEPSPHMIRVLAVHPGTTVHFDPPVSPDVVVGTDEPFEIAGLTEDVRVTGDGPLLVAQLMYGSDAVPSNFGDPSLSVAVPVEQFRKDYAFLTPLTYDQSWVNVVAEIGAEVIVDGVVIDVAAFEPIGASGWGVARQLLGATEAHTASSASPFGITVYGYGAYTSYMYPGGLELKKLTTPPPL